MGRCVCKPAQFVLDAPSHVNSSGNLHSCGGHGGNMPVVPQYPPPSTEWLEGALGHRVVGPSGTHRTQLSCGVRACTPITMLLCCFVPRVYHNTRTLSFRQRMFLLLRQLLWRLRQPATVAHSRCCAEDGFRACGQGYRLQRLPSAHADKLDVHLLGAVVSGYQWNGPNVALHRRTAQGLRVEAPGHKLQRTPIFDHRCVAHCLCAQVVGDMLQRQP